MTSELKQVNDCTNCYNCSYPASTVCKMCVDYSSWTLDPDSDEEPTEPVNPVNPVSEEEQHVSEYFRNAIKDLEKFQPKHSAANSYQVGGDHYITSGAYQPWNVMEAWMSHKEFKGFLRGNVIKYIARSEEKGGIQDLKKAQHYLSKLIEQE